MSLLQEIQTAILTENSNVGTILLKLKFLASKLGNDVLEDWVNHESEGYPDEVDVPDYRKMGVTYTGSFSGSYGREVKNAPIPSALVQKFGGEHWTLHECRQGISSIEDLISDSKEGTSVIEIDASNLILLLQGKIYPDYSCYQISGIISESSFAEITHIVKSRALDLTLKLEKSIEGARDISVTRSPAIKESESEHAEQITHQVIYGNLTNITNSGASSNITVNNRERDLESFTKTLVSNGISESDASTLSEIVSQEEPTDKEGEPLGKNATKWVTENLKKAANGSWKIGVTAATAVVKEAALRYYGLK